MALRMTVISNHDFELGEQGTAIFGTTGGSIGRAPDNDWVLPDPHRYISSHHARVRYRNGGYLVEDTSTNGLFLNEAADPVGRLGPQPLRPGDVLQLGPYKIKVTDDSAPYEASAVVTFTTPGTDTGDHGPHGPDIGVDLDINELLVMNPEISAERRAYDPWGQRIDDSALLQFDNAQQSASVRTLRAPTRALPTGPSPILAPGPPTGATGITGALNPNAAGGGLGGLDTFCRGAGLDPRKLPVQAQERLLRLSGLLLREALVGVKDLANAQREAGLAAGLAAPVDDPERLALQGQPVEDLLVRLLTGHDSQQLDAVQWIREVFGLATRHDAAIMRALRPALEEFTNRLAPAALNPGAGAQERFHSITESPKGQLPHLFSEALARAFKAEITLGPEKG